MRRAAVLAACAVAAAAQATDDGGGFTCLACASEESLTAWYVAVSGTEYTCDPSTYPAYVNKDGVPTTAHVFKHPACSYEYGTRAGATDGAVSWVMQWCADDGTIWEASDCACEAAGGGACAAPGWDDDGYDDDDAPCDYDPGSCVDDRTTTDSGGDDCAWYECNQGECGAYDDRDFAARDQCCACGGGTLAPSSYDDDTKKPSSSDDGGLWVTADVGTYDEMQAACEQGGGHLVVPASEAERLAARAAVQASDHGDVDFWVGYELPSGSDPGTMANYDGENGLTMEEVGYYLWDSNCGKCGTSKSWDRCVHHTTDATGGDTPGYYMATCSGPRPGVCQPPKDLWVTA
mmetsp:Transcript_13226/g.35113  ORF Transcript_13226/g.35113 Transcript_13226/m.35113 type:complete len:348 (+) Transcript_13226:157-1200(+)